MTTKYKAGPIVTEVKRLQKEFPEAVYINKSGMSCSYSKGSVSKGPKTRGCIVGQAIRVVYPELFKIAKKKFDSATVGFLTMRLGIEATDGQLAYLARTQQNQDFGYRWGGRGV